MLIIGLIINININKYINTKKLSSVSDQPRRVEAVCNNNQGGVIDPKFDPYLGFVPSEFRFSFLSRSTQTPEVFLLRRGDARYGGDDGRCQSFRRNAGDVRADNRLLDLFGDLRAARLAR